MIKSYFTIAIRNIIKTKGYSFVNIISLSIGIAGSLIILLWLNNELSYDRFHKNANEIYRVVGEDAIVHKIAVSPGPLAEALRNGFPEIVYATRYMPYSGSSFKYNDKILYENKGVFVDPSFFEMFSFPFIKGDSKTALSDLSDIVITESFAKRLFGNDDPFGKTITIEGKDLVKVSAIVKDPPSNSQIQFNFAVNTLILKYVGLPIDNWGSASFHTFIQVHKTAKIDNLENGVADLMPKYVPGFSRKLFLEPLTEIHLCNDYMADLPALGDKKYIYIFASIALFLIVIACINYINLSLAHTEKRIKEVSLRKIAGSGRFQLISRFIVESLIVILVASIIALALVLLFSFLLPQLNNINLANELSEISVLRALIPLMLLTFLLAGIYPAIYFSFINPITILKGLIGNKQRKVIFRKALVVVQFAITVILLVGTLIVNQQLNYLKNKKLGFDRENTVFFKAKGEFNQNYDVMKNILLKNPDITDVTAEDRLLLNSTSSTTELDWEGKDPKKNLNIEYSSVDYNYFNMLNVEIIDGRNFSQQLQSDKTAYILNEEAIKQMNLENPVGKQFRLNKITGTIIGIIKSTNFKSLHHKIEPCAYRLLNDKYSTSFRHNGVILIKANFNHIESVIASIEKTWKEVNPDLPFEYHFLNETIDNQYQIEKQTGQIFGYFSLISILISCLGLYAMSYLITETRTKEIGIRKFLGASVPNIMNMIYKDYIKWILLANIIAWPIAWYAMNKWLRNYAYKVDMSWWVFALSGVIALTVALLTIAWQTRRAATANPVKSLKYE